jgi:hypothetical protein
MATLQLMLRLLVSLVFLLPAVTWADEDARFSRLKDQAQALPSLGSFLENYIGDCGNSSASTECKEKAKAFRQKTTGKKFYMMISEEEATMVAPGAIDPSGECTVNVAPLFAAGGYAVTHGAPKKTDAAGNPMVMYLQAKGTIPEGWSTSRFSRLFSTRALRLQVVFTPEGTWSLPKKGGSHQGVKAKIEAIYVTVGRTGEPVGLWLADRTS